jgi:hypothetical protein
MEQSSQNENRISNEDECEIIMDDALEEERTRDPSENHDSLQTNVLTLEERDYVIHKAKQFKWEGNSFLQMWVK